MTLGDANTDAKLNSVDADSEVLVPSGTASSPTVVFSGATGTGIYRDGTADWGVSIDGTEALTIGSSAGVSLPNGTLTAQGSPAIDAQGDIRLATGQSIEDENGTKRVEFASDYTAVYSNTGRISFNTNDGTATRAYAYSDQRFDVYDSEGSFNAIKYSTSASAPGTLTLDAYTYIKDGAGLVVGNDSFESGRGLHDTQILGTGLSDSSVSMGRFQDDKNAAAELDMVRSRAGSIGGTAALQAGDKVGRLMWFADDGSDQESRPARIDVEIDGSVSANDTPGRVIFATAQSGGNTTTEALRIDSSQDVRVQNGQILVQDGSASAPAIAFDKDTDTGLFRKATNQIGFGTSGTEKVAIEGPDLVMSKGGSIEQVGGTADASSGAIRLANNANISFRDGGDTADVLAMSVGSGDKLYLGSPNDAGVVMNRGGGQIESSNDGSASAPAYTFVDDTDTGVHRVAADTWAVATGGSEGFRVDDNQNLNLDSGGNLTRGGRSEYVEGKTIADDASATYDISGRSLILVCPTRKSNGVALVATGFNLITELVSTNVSIEGNSTTLSGTDGPDGTLNIAINDNTLHVENRTGESDEYKVMSL
jgi:hypothetical protein